MFQFLIPASVPVQLGHLLVWFRLLPLQEFGWLVWLRLRTKATWYQGFWVNSPVACLKFELNDCVLFSFPRSIPVHQAKKRKHSDSPNSTLNSQILTGIIKQEPGRQASFFIFAPSLTPAHLLLLTLNTDWDLLNGAAVFTFSFLTLACLKEKLFVTGLMQDADNSYLDPNYQCIKWQPHLQNKWTPLYDINCKELWVHCSIFFIYCGHNCTVWSQMSHKQSTVSKINWVLIVLLQNSTKSTGTAKE